MVAFTVIFSPEKGWLKINWEMPELSGAHTAFSGPEPAGEVSDGARAQVYARRDGRRQAQWRSGHQRLHEDDCTEAQPAD